LAPLVPTVGAGSGSIGRSAVASSSLIVGIAPRLADVCVSGKGADTSSPSTGASGQMNGPAKDGFEPEPNLEAEAKPGLHPLIIVIIIVFVVDHTQGRLKWQPLPLLRSAALLERVASHPFLVGPLLLLVLLPLLPDRPCPSAPGTRRFSNLADPMDEQEARLRRRNKDKNKSRFYCLPGTCSYTRGTSGQGRCN
jgi:hypothetical protein